MSEGVRPRHFEDTDIWIRRINREWQFRDPVDLHGSVEPAVVEAASGHTLTVTLKVGAELNIPEGGHITMEVPATWEAHLGSCFRRAVRTVGNREQIRPGYGAFTDVECSNPDVRLEWAASWGRILNLVDVVVAQGEIGPGDEVRLILGPPDGNLVRVQKHAQVAILTVGVDLTGEQDYRRAATHPELRVVGGPPDRFRVFAPAVVKPGEEFRLRVLPVDVYRFNPATGYKGTVRFFSDDKVQVPASVGIDSSKAPKGIELSARAAAGEHHITVLDPAAGISGRSGPIAAGFLVDRRIYFGEMHSQMWHSMGTGTTAEFFEWGRDNAGLDFCAPANHYNWRFEVTDDVWRELVETCNTFNEAGRFVTMIGYETGHAAGKGHRNVYYRGDEAEFDYWYQEPRDPDRMWAKLPGRDVFTVPHHPKAFEGFDWSYRSDRYDRLVEICSQWGISETGGEHSVQTALAMGHRLGFVGGTDSHYGLANQGSYHVNDGNGLAGVMAKELTRDAIWRALYERRCYATTGDHIVLDFTMNGHPMGTDLDVDLAGVGQRRFRMRIAGTYRIDAVDLLRNNQVVFSANPRADVWEGEWTDSEPLEPLALAPRFPYDRPFVFYYLRLTQGNRQRAWASPIWLTQRG